MAELNGQPLEVPESPVRENTAEIREPPAPSHIGLSVDEFLRNAKFAHPPNSFFKKCANELLSRNRVREDRINHLDELSLGFHEGTQSLKDGLYSAIAHASLQATVHVSSDVVTVAAVSYSAPADEPELSDEQMEEWVPRAADMLEFLVKRPEMIKVLRRLRLPRTATDLYPLPRQELLILARGTATESASASSGTAAAAPSDGEPEEQHAVSMRLAAVRAVLYPLLVPEVRAVLVRILDNDIYGYWDVFTRAERESAMNEGRRERAAREEGAGALKAYKKEQRKRQQEETEDEATLLKDHNELAAWHALRQLSCGGIALHSASSGVWVGVPGLPQAHAFIHQLLLPAIDVYRRGPWDSLTDALLGTGGKQAPAASAASRSKSGAGRLAGAGASSSSSSSSADARHAAEGESDAVAAAFTNPLPVTSLAAILSHDSLPRRLWAYHLSRGDRAPSSATALGCLLYEGALNCIAPAAKPDIANDALLEEALTVLCRDPRSPEAYLTRACVEVERWRTVGSHISSGDDPLLRLLRPRLRHVIITHFLPHLRLPREQHLGWLTAAERFEDLLMLLFNDHTGWPNFESPSDLYLPGVSYRILENLCMIRERASSGHHRHGFPALRLRPAEAKALATVAGDEEAGEAHPGGGDDDSESDEDEGAGAAASRQPSRSSKSGKAKSKKAGGARSGDGGDSGTGVLVRLINSEMRRVVDNQRPEWVFLRNMPYNEPVVMYVAPMAAWEAMQGSQPGVFVDVTLPKDADMRNIVVTGLRLYNPAPLPSAAGEAPKPANGFAAAAAAASSLSASDGEDEEVAVVSSKGDHVYHDVVLLPRDQGDALLRLPPGESLPNPRRAANALAHETFLARVLMRYAYEIGIDRARVDRGSSLVWGHGDIAHLEALATVKTEVDHEAEEERRVAALAAENARWVANTYEAHAPEPEELAQDDYLLEMALQGISSSSGGGEGELSEGDRAARVAELRAERAAMLARAKVRHGSDHDVRAPRAAFAREAPLSPASLPPLEPGLLVRLSHDRGAGGVAEEYLARVLDVTSGGSVSVLLPNGKVIEGAGYGFWISIALGFREGEGGAGASASSSAAAPSFAEAAARLAAIGLELLPSGAVRDARPQVGQQPSSSSRSSSSSSSSGGGGDVPEALTVQWAPPGALLQSLQWGPLMTAYELGPGGKHGKAGLRLRVGRDAWLERQSALETIFADAVRARTNMGEIRRHWMQSGSLGEVYIQHLGATGNRAKLLCRLLLEGSLPGPHAKSAESELVRSHGGYRAGGRLWLRDHFPRELDRNPNEGGTSAGEARAMRAWERGRPFRAGAPAGAAGAASASASAADAVPAPAGSAAAAVVLAPAQPVVIDVDASDSAAGSSVAPSEPVVIVDLDETTAVQPSSNAVASQPVTAAEPASAEVTVAEPGAGVSAAEPAAVATSVASAAPAPSAALSASAAHPVLEDSEDEEDETSQMTCVRLVDDDDGAAPAAQPAAFTSAAIDAPATASTAAAVALSPLSPLSPLSSAAVEPAASSPAPVADSEGHTDAPAGASSFALALELGTSTALPSTAVAAASATSDAFIAEPVPPSAAAANSASLESQATAPVGFGGTTDDDDEVQVIEDTPVEDTPKVRRSGRSVVLACAESAAAVGRGSRKRPTAAVTPPAAPGLDSDGPQAKRGRFAPAYPASASSSATAGSADISAAAPAAAAGAELSAAASVAAAVASSKQRTRGVTARQVVAKHSVSDSERDSDE